ncbi:DNA polymerase III subunit delta' [Enterovirga rhinocerotis]|uniref:DNA polymerase-3 subunit delta n=1 Tax=Enterovirga rhinocerotis TaxID=1339210 RepID=A0A4R7CB50_9HYPH|nr:DNA polymerase III subunit delta' [Enterovirga rhinocerotis]TDR94286.1 DNA polymerase-3 subunit delta' [Enterovirga rhinocerotis]
MAIEDIAHPREQHALFGHQAARRALGEGALSGRLHHAWLIGGPEGIGKATLAYRFARHLLASPGERRPEDDGFGIDPEGRTARQIAALSHPNLIAIERAGAEDGKAAARTISVEAVRKALAFFSSTAADGGRRICIIDGAEDLTIAAANALLKTIEEPPAGALVLIVSHAPQRLLPTIRSRCRKLALSALPDEDVRAALSSLGTDPVADIAARAIGMAEGSVGRALTLMDPKRIALIDELTALLDSLPAAPAARVMSLADKLADRRSGDELPVALDTLVRWLSRRVGEGAHKGAARLAPLAELCENVLEAARTVETYNLDRRAFIVSTFGDLAEAVRRAA